MVKLSKAGLYTIILSMAAAGLIIQIYQISDRYFKFKTSTKIKIENPDFVTIPKLSTCWELEDMLDYTALGQELNITFPDREAEDSDELYFESIKQLQLQNYFDFTPGNESILQNSSGCTVRYPQKWTVKHPQPTATECYRIFRIKRYIHRGMICYNFQFETGNLAGFDSEYALAPEMSGLMYKLFFRKELFSKVTSFSSFVHGSRTSLTGDSILSQRKQFNSLNPEDLFSLAVSFGSIERSLLPPPYDTDCRSIDGIDGSEYFFKGLRRMIIDKVGLIDSFIPIIEKNHNSSNLALLGPEYLINQSIVDRIVEIKTDLNKNYKIACHAHHYVSTQEVEYGSDVAVGVYWPNGYFINVNYVEDQLLIDYIVYVCSSIGIWFGLSFVSLIGAIEKCFAKPLKRGHSNVLKIRALFRYFTIVTNNMKVTIAEQNNEIAFLKQRLINLE